MKKIQYRPSAAPTCWGIVDVPNKPFIKGLPQNCRINCSITSCVCSDKKGITYQEALQFALKNWIPIQVEDQEKVAKNIVFKTFAEMANPDESKLYDIPDGMEFKINDEWINRLNNISTWQPIKTRPRNPDGISFRKIAYLIKDVVTSNVLSGEGADQTHLTSPSLKSKVEEKKEQSNDENWIIVFQLIREGKYDLVKSKFQLHENNQ